MSNDDDEQRRRDRHPEHLIETCKDGEYGFRTCAEHVKSAQLQPGLH